MACFHCAPVLSVLIEAKTVALAGAISAPAMLWPPELALAEVFLLLLPQAARTSTQQRARAREREIRRI
jgi:hypothetical protein